MQSYLFYIIYCLNNTAELLHDHESVINSKFSLNDSKDNCYILYENDLAQPIFTIYLDRNFQNL